MENNDLILVFKILESIERISLSLCFAYAVYRLTR